MPATEMKCALVTGGSRGIGAAIAKRLAADGFAVAVNYAGNTEAAAGVVAAIEAAGGRARAFQADVADPDAVRSMIDTVTESFGTPEVLVNSAGILTLSPIAEMEDEAFDRLIAVNLKGTFNTLREASRRMAPGGRVINLSTSVIGMRLPSYALYAATKSAVEVMGAVLANELRGRGITVNAVAPGPTATELFLDGKTEEQIAGLANANPLQRLGEPEDIAGVVSFLAGPDGGWVNGQTLRANGGMN
ncbi:SDR family oxidoreductase [Marivibrio halodurans]|uniref:SDR family oxidoreductase n=1 Tax=Marivibrio halodurans TaxID=2039722 RepID=A0A8J7S1B3_9PROT|nr:SDR family oxidoreductase [Marivibrio halodurans]MBP5858527.1 SDR family oxidoreductase [Marivibrio halodurans]